MIKLTYSSVDGFHKRKQFKLLRGARKFAQEWIGKNPSVSSMGYAVSDDGVGKIHSVTGCRLSDLFGDEPKEVDDGRATFECNFCKHKFRAGVRSYGDVECPKCHEIDVEVV